MKVEVGGAGFARYFGICSFWPTLNPKVPCGGSSRLRSAGGGPRRVRGSFVRLRGGPLAGPPVRRFSGTIDSRPLGCLLLWALLPRTARRSARVARHRFLSDSRALLRGEEAGGAGGEGTRRRREAPGERGPLTEECRGKSWGRAPAQRPAGPLPAQSSRAAGVWRGRGSESGAREPSSS